MQVDDTRPIWIQLVDAFRHRIVSGQWEPGSKIPSVRELATGATDAYVVALTGLGMSLDGATRLLAERWTDRPATGEPQS